MPGFLREPEIGSEEWEEEKRVHDQKHAKFWELDGEYKGIMNSLKRAKTGARKQDLQNRLRENTVKRNKIMNDITKETIKDKARGAVKEIGSEVENTKLRIKKIKEKYSG